MDWRIEFDLDAIKDLKKLGRTEQKRIVKFFKERIATLKDPRASGKPLKGSFGGLWRYRVGNYRAICKIEDNNLNVLVIAIGHRSKIYKFKEN